MRRALAVLSLAVITACGDGIGATSSSSGPGGESPGDPRDPGSSDPAASGAAAPGSVVAKPKIAVVRVAEGGAVHASTFSGDGLGWLDDSLAAPPSRAFESPEVAVAEDGSMMVVALSAAAGGPSAPRVPVFARWTGGAWTALAPIPGAATDLGSEPVSLVARGGSFVLAYARPGVGVSYLTYDRAAERWSAPSTMTATKGAVALSLERGAPGARDLYLAFLDDSETYGVPFDPFAASVPTPEPAHGFEGYERGRALPMRVPGGSDVRVALARNGHAITVTGRVLGVESSRFDLSLCPFSYDAFVDPTDASRVLVACTAGADSPIVVWRGQLAGPSPALAWSRVDTQAPLDAYRARFVPGFGGELGYAIGTSGAKVVAVRLPDGAVTELGAQAAGGFGAGYGP